MHHIPPRLPRPPALRRPHAARPAAPAPVAVPVTGSALDAQGNRLTVSGMLSVTPPAAGPLLLFVSPWGSDTLGTGAAAAPFATPARALQAALPGTTITLAGGTYAGALTVPVAGVTLTSAPGQTALLAASLTDPNQVNAVNLEAPNITLQGLEISGGYWHGVKVDVSPATISNCKIHDVGDSCVKIPPGTADVTVKGTECYRGGRREPNNAPMIDAVKSDRLTVSDCFLHDTPNYGVVSKGGGRNTLVQRCRIDNAWCGVVLGQSTDLVWFDRATNPDLDENIDGTVQNCRVRHTLYAGIGCWAARRPRILNNTLLDVAQAGQGGIFLYTSEHYPVGVEVDEPCRDVLIENNVVSVSLAGGAPNVYIQAHALAGRWLGGHNDYWRGGLLPLFWDANNYPPQTLFQPDLAGWIAKWSDAGSLSVDPRLDPDGRPLAGSPVIGAALVEPAVVDDLNGAPRLFPGTIGAFQAPAAPVSPAAKRKREG